MAEKLHNFNKGLEFANWAQQQDHLLFILDGANIVHKSSNEISITRLTSMISYLEQLDNALVIVILSAYKERQLKEQNVLDSLKKSNRLFVTPSRQHDDWLMLELARKKIGIIISNDRFREYEPYYPKLIPSKLLQYFIATCKNDEHTIIIPEIELTIKIYELANESNAQISSEISEINEELLQSNIEATSI